MHPPLSGSKFSVRTEKTVNTLEFFLNHFKQAERNTFCQLFLMIFKKWFIREKEIFMNIFDYCYWKKFFSILNLWKFHNRVKCNSKQLFHSCHSLDYAARMLQSLRTNNFTLTLRNLWVKTFENIKLLDNIIATMKWFKSAAAGHGRKWQTWIFQSGLESLGLVRCSPNSIRIEMWLENFEALT